ncbi:acyl carrier protein phosphodiesterase [Gramella sp. GC03-9]|uniref:Acyl carrier protein phosphodiesterase n=1 Tax=Christiangramia oceanisediminis TaxID=2920386 RepID=A0A9X2I5N5_9FLAO|nr:acyl carrier protein phosphodiesterase [Gramella oceanisediminis]MCP9199862.1 acyl carrier protein phosphodiesterase [Gramella oceanisediminis]
MNFLAHIYLSGNDYEIKIGNFMADSIKGKKYLEYPQGIQNGIILHRAIDYYTDTHPVFQQSTSRLFERYGHYNGIIADIFYDHFLASNWNDYSETPLEQYTEEFYDLLRNNYELLPAKVRSFLPYMIEGNWLLSYAEIEGIQQVLVGMNKRTGRKSGMHLAVEELVEFYEEFQKEFREFFSEAIEFSRIKLQELKK